MLIKLLNTPPKYVAAAAVYAYSDELYAEGARESKYGDPYNIFEIIGNGVQRRILVPRNMIPAGVLKSYSYGMDAKFKSYFIPRNDEQARVVAESLQLLEHGRSFITQCPTGFGKTALATDVIAKVGKKVIIVVTKEDIRDQWIDAAKKFLHLTDKEIGVIQGDKCQILGKKFVVAMVQSIAKEGRYPLHQLKDFGLAIWDECHRVGADEFAHSCFRLPSKLRWGLSATPDRKDGRMETIEAHIGPVKVTSTLAPMTPKVISRVSPWQLPMTKVKDPKTGLSKAGPLPHSPAKCGHVINMLSRHHGRNTMLAQFTHAAYKKGRFILVQSDRKEHLECLHMMVQKLGVPPGEMAYYVGGMTKEQREYAKTMRVIFATYMMTAEATDIPRLDTLVMGTPKSDVRQIVGRIIRAVEGKQQPIVFDLLDNTSKVFSGYWNSRRVWYGQVGAEISTGT